MSKRGNFKRQLARQQVRATKSNAPKEPVIAPERYPPPAYAASVWLTPEGLRLALPASLGEPGHAVLLPRTLASWSILLEILHARANASARNARTIGNRASPVQYDIEGMIRAFGNAGGHVSRPSPAPLPTTLDDLGLGD